MYSLFKSIKKEIKKKIPNDNIITMYTSQLKPVIQIKKYVHKPENFETHNHYISCFIHICFYIIYMHYVFMHVCIYFWHYMKCYKISLI